MNIARYFGIFQRSLFSTCSEEGKTPKPKEGVDPLESFIMAHLEHPDMDSLLEALENQDRESSDRHPRRISSDGWKRYLQRTRRSDTRAMFAYPARSEGRKRWGFAPADSTPMRNAQGRPILAPQDKVNLITQTFRMRFSAPRVTDPSISDTDPNLAPLRPFRRPVNTPFCPVQLL